MTTTLTGYCSRCGKVWTLDTGQGICQWCNKPATAKTTTSKPRQLKSSRRHRQRQANGNGHNGYDQLQGEWLHYYKVASRFHRKAKLEDREDLLHDTMLTLALAERNNGHKPFTEAVMYRIASRCVADYWFRHYKITNGLDCGHCSKAQRSKCKQDYLYPKCPKAIKMESLNKPVLDDDGNLTELGELIADDGAVDLDDWVSSTVWEIGYPQRLVDIAYKLKVGIALTNYDMVYLTRYRKKRQKRLIE